MFFFANRFTEGVTKYHYRIDCGGKEKSKRKTNDRPTNLIECLTCKNKTDIEWEEIQQLKKLHKVAADKFIDKQVKSGERPPVQHRSPKKSTKEYQKKRLDNDPELRRKVNEQKKLSHAKLLATNPDAKEKERERKRKYDQSDKRKKQRENKKQKIVEENQ